ncbi:glycosyltransferase [Aquibium carbonis]|uniref:glycosyltransferase n=1 Tax=Aquibium carbonis TaxID=2495581 RepID=UPI001FE1FD6A|nr:glycosyltransferase [Aquibium carbonis]
MHLERVHAGWISAGSRNLLLPNQERFPRRHIDRLGQIDLVLAKTRHATDIFSALGRPTEYLGFTSYDRQDLSVQKDWTRFLHLAGGSTLKGTEDILDLWRAHPEWPELVVIQKAENLSAAFASNITLLPGYLSDAELRRQQNACGIHLCPSRAEGWGHHLIEGLSVGSVVVTTDGPPMNEMVTPDCGILVPVASSTPRHLGTCYHVDRLALERAIEAVLAKPDTEKAALGVAARRRYEDIAVQFADRVRSIVG